MAYLDKKVKNIEKDIDKNYYTSSEVDNLLAKKADTEDASSLTESAINSSTNIDKTGVTDTSKFPLLNGASDDTLVHITYADLKLLLKDYFDTLYTPL